MVAAARQLAQGQPPAPLPEDGPEEIATVGRSFNHMAHSLAAAEQERALMLAGVSHDLRTPLTKLRLGVEIAGAQVDAPLAASMARSIDEMDGIVGQFLQFARVGSNAGEAEAPTTASLNNLAQAVAINAGGPTQSSQWADSGWSRSSTATPAAVRDHGSCRRFSRRS